MERSRVPRRAGLARRAPEEPSPQYRPGFAGAVPVPAERGRKHRLRPATSHGRPDRSRRPRRPRPRLHHPPAGRLSHRRRRARRHALRRRAPKALAAGERGASLSGGERQRLSIARALLLESPLLILDEPTSALDAETEAALLDAIEKLKGSRTIFVIAHRLSTVQRADRIVVLKEGRIVEEGTHAELLARGGVYAGFYNTQFGKPLESNAQQES